MKRFLSLGELDPAEIEDLLALARRLERAPEPRALEGKILALLFLAPSLRTLVSMQAAMARLGGTAIAATAGAGSWKIETRAGIVMDGEAAEHAREAIPVLASYADALGVRAFAAGEDLDSEVADRDFRALAALAGVPFVNLESAADHPCQALGDWKTLDDLGVPRRGRLVLTWANHPKALPLAVPAAVAEMAALRGMETVVVRPEPFALPAPIAERARRAARASGGSFRETDAREEALAGADVLYAKSWASSVAYGDAAAERALRDALAGWCVRESWFAAAPRARFLHCLPVRRNVVVEDAVLDSPRSAVIAQARNRMWAQMAVLHRLLAGERKEAA